MGFRKIITYILQSEPGITMKAIGWNIEEPNAGGGKMVGTCRQGPVFSARKRSSAK